MEKKKVCDVCGVKKKKGKKVKGELQTEQLKPMQITPSDCVIVFKGFSVKSWLTL